MTTDHKPEPDYQKFATEAGVDAFKLLVDRSEQALAEREFVEIFTAMVAAAELCFANVLRPAVEMSPAPEKTADALLETSMKHIRELLKPVIEKKQP